MLLFSNHDCFFFKITHAFDHQASQFNRWSENSRKEYNERVQCIIDQYSNYRVKEVEEYENIDAFYLNGNFTQKEDIADCGGVKLSLNAFKKFENEFPESKIIPIGLHEFDSDQLFWLSFAQTFCRFDKKNGEFNCY